LGLFGRNHGAEEALAFTAYARLTQGDVDEERRLQQDAVLLLEQQPYYEGNAYALEVAAAHALHAGAAVGAPRTLGLARGLRERIHTTVRDALGDGGVRRGLRRRPPGGPRWCARSRPPEPHPGLRTA
jgi:hypothetical protein